MKDSQISDLQKQINDLKLELDKYIKSGFWSRRDVVKGGFGLLGLAALAGVAKGDTQITDTAISIGSVTVETTAGSQAKVDTHAALNVAAGVHPNANTHINAASPHSAHLIAAVGTLPATVTNYAIAHGLGRTPKDVLWATDNGATVMHGKYNTDGTKQVGVGAGAWTGRINYANTAWDATNFYTTTAEGLSGWYIVIG